MQTPNNVDLNSFARRHIGPSEAEVAEMLSEVGFENLDSLIDAAVPKISAWIGN
jgi:glycine dehydrogenase